MFGHGRRRTPHFHTFDGDREVLRYVDDVVTAAAVAVDVPQFEDGSASSDWLDRLVACGVRPERPDIEVVHDGVVQ